MRVKGIVNVYCLRYTDDTVISADTNQILQDFTTVLVEVGKRIGLRINLEIIKVQGNTKRRGRINKELPLHPRRVRQIPGMHSWGYALCDKR